MSIMTRKVLPSTPFSEFFRNASSRDKKRVYAEVIKKSSESQAAIIAQANKAG